MTFFHFSLRYRSRSAMLIEAELEKVTVSLHSICTRNNIYTVVVALLY